MLKHLAIASCLICAAMGMQAQNQVVDSLEPIHFSKGAEQVKLAQYKNKQTLWLDSLGIASSASNTIDQALRQLPGVDVRQRSAAGIQTDISIDGGTFDQSILLVNGLKLTDPQTGHNMMVLPFELSMVRQMQVIKGAASSMYGVNALTGAINIVTMQPTKNYLQVGLTSGSSFRQHSDGNPYYNIGGWLQGGLVSGKFNHTFQAGWKNGNGYRKNTSFSSPNFYYESNGLIKKHEVQLMSGYRYLDFGANGFYAAPGDSNSHETVQNAFVGIKHQLPVSKNIRWMSDVVYNYKTDDYKYIKEPVLGHNIHYQNIINVTTALQYKSKIGNLKLGLEWRQEHLNSTNLGSRARSNIGMLFNYHKLFDSRWLLEAGAYANQNSAFGFQVYPNVSIGFLTNNQAKLFANVSTSQRLPTFTDLYYKQRGVIEGNDQLQAERAINIELGYQKKVQNYSMAAYVFYRSIEDFIDWTKQDLTDVWRPTNYHQLNTLGLHMSVDKTFIINSHLTMGGKLGYNYLNPEMKLTSDNTISRYAINALRHQVVSNAFMYLNGKFKFQVGANFYSRVSYKDYWMLNASVGYFKDKWQVDLNIHNAADVTVVEAGAQPLPGRWMQLTTRFTL